MTTESIAQDSLRYRIEQIVPGSSEEAVTIDGVPAALTVSPANGEQLREVVRLAASEKLVIVPAGGMTRQRMGAAPEKIDVIVRITNLDQVYHYDAGDLTFGVGAGITVAKAQQHLSSQGQWLPFDPPNISRSTIGGALAVNARGPLQAGYGGLRDYCIGIEFVTADAKLVKGGGRVVKNVAGYDLMKLMIGSFGTLGIITAANFKVFPRPRQTRSFALDFSTAAEALAFRDVVLRAPYQSNLLCVEIASPRAQEYLKASTPRDPDHYSPQAPMDLSPHWTVYLRATGSDRALQRIESELGQGAVPAVTGAIEDQLWLSLSDFEASILARHRNAMIVHVESPLRDIAAVLAAAQETALEHNFVFAAIGRVTVGSLVIAFLPLAVDPPSAMQFAAAVSSFRGRLPLDVSDVVACCPREAKDHFDVWGNTPTDLSIMRRVRQALDPDRIFNRGRFMI